jgi:hypothetical protein
MLHDILFGSDPGLDRTLRDLRDVVLMQNPGLPLAVSVMIMKLTDRLSLKVIVLQSLGRVANLDDEFKREENTEVLARFMDKLEGIQERMLDHKDPRLFVSECETLYNSVLKARTQLTVSVDQGGHEADEQKADEITEDAARGAAVHESS